MQKIQHLPDVFLCYTLYVCVHAACDGAGHLHVDGVDYDVGAGMSHTNDSAVQYEIHGDYDVPFDRYGGVAHRGAFVHNMFQDDDVMYGDDVVESDYVVYGDTVVLGSVVQAEYVVQPAYVVHGDNVIGDDEVQSDYVVLDDEFAVQIGSVIHCDNVVQYDDVQCC